MQRRMENYYFLSTLSKKLSIRRKSKCFSTSENGYRFCLLKREKKRIVYESGYVGSQKIADAWTNRAVSLDRRMTWFVWLRIRAGAGRWFSRHLCTNPARYALQGYPLSNAEYVRVVLKVCRFWGRSVDALSLAVTHFSKILYTFLLHRIGLI